MQDTLTARAANGHVFEYQVIGAYSDGRPKVQQFNAQHAESCDCHTWEGADRSIPDW